MFSVSCPAMSLELAGSMFYCLLVDMTPRFTQLCLPEQTALSNEQGVPDFLAEILMSVCFFLLPFLKKKKKKKNKQEQWQK